MVVCGSGFLASFCKILNGFIIKCETKAGIVHNFEVYSFKLCEMFTKSETYRLTYLRTGPGFFLPM